MAKSVDSSKLRAQNEGDSIINSALTRYCVEVFKEGSGHWKRFFVFAPNKTAAKEIAKPTTDEFISQYAEKTGWKVDIKKAD